MEFPPFIKTIAPWIGTALGGPLGGLAVEAATKALGGSEKTAEGLKAALAGASQQDLLNLKKADLEFQARMAELGYKNQADLEGIAASDRDSARKLATATGSSVPRNLTYFLTLGMVVLIGALIFKGIPDSGVVQLLLGNYTTAWVASTIYWFGSTSGSALKTDIISRSQPVGK